MTFWKGLKWCQIEYEVVSMFDRSAHCKPTPNTFYFPFPKAALSTIYLAFTANMLDKSALSQKNVGTSHPREAIVLMEDEQMNHHDNEGSYIRYPKVFARSRCRIATTPKWGIIPNSEPNFHQKDFNKLSSPLCTSFQPSLLRVVALFDSPLYSTLQIRPYASYRLLSLLSGSHGGILCLRCCIHSGGFLTL